MPKRFSKVLLALLVLDVPSCCDFTRVLRVQMNIDERKVRIYFEDICVIINIHLNHIFCFRTSFHHGNGRDIASASLSRICMRNLPNAYEALMLVAYLLFIRVKTRMLHHVSRITVQVLVQAFV